MFLESHKNRFREWFMEKAEGKSAKWWLAIISLSESSFFPIPVDPFLMAVLVVDRKRWLFYSLFVSGFSVLGGVLGYLIGFLFFEFIGVALVNFYHLQDELQTVSGLFAENVFWSTFVAAFTPIPYKIITISAGLFKVDFITFLVASIIGRSLRYLIVGFSMKVFGRQIAKIVFKYFNIISMVIVLLIVVYILIQVF